MALDKEIKLIEEDNSEYAINPYTIQYDSKTKRFFKGFAPKAGWGGLVTATIFGAATIATGGIAAATVGIVAGTSVALGALATTAYSGIVYRRNAAKSRFKALGIGGKEDSVGTIGVVQEYENYAYKYVKMMEDNPSQTKFILEDGRSYSRRDLKKRIKENEDMAYHGLKYLLEQGTFTSRQLERLRQKINLTPREEDAMAKYWDVMDRISQCVKQVTSKRTKFNPYKALIIDAMQDGCLLGDLRQNNEIRKIKALNNKDMTTKLYFEMYEKHLLESEKAKVPAKPPITKREYDQLKRDNKNLEDQLTAEQAKSEKLEAKYASEQTKHKKATEMALKQRSKKRDAENRIADMEAESQAQAEKLENENKKYQRERDLHKKATERALKQRAKKIEAEKRIAEVEAEKQAQIEQLNKQNQKFERERNLHKKATERALNQRAKNKELTNQVTAQQQEITMSEDQTEYAMSGWYDAEQLTKEQAKQIAKLQSQMGKNKRKHKKATRMIAQLIEENNTLETQIDEAAYESGYWQARAEGAEDTVKVIYSGRQELEQENISLQSKNEAIKKNYARSRTQNKKLREDIANSKQVQQQQADQINSLNDDINTLVAAQSENINRIMDLETDNEILQQKNKDTETKLASAKRATVKARKQRDDAKQESKQNAELAENLGWDLHKTQKELELIISERDSYKQGVKDLEDEKVELLTKLDDETKRADIAQAWEDIKHHNFVRGGAIRRMNNLIDKIDAHIEYTKEVQDDAYDKQAVKELEHYTNGLRAKNADALDLEEINTLTKLLKAVYKVHGRNLQPANSKKLKEIVDEMHTLTIVDTTTKTK